jgi:GxxExxY protein
MAEESDGASLPHESTTRPILAAFFDVRNELGHGFSETVYRRALVMVLRARGLKVAEEVLLPVHFRGTQIATFRADVIVNGVVLVEVKAAAAIESYAEAQTLNYLKAAGGGVGMLLNFGRVPTFKRLVMGDAANSLPFLKHSLDTSKSAREV